MKEFPYVPAANGPDEYLDEAINKIETFEGGRIAALPVDIWWALKTTPCLT